MLRNYIKVTIRSLLRNKVFTVVNILGLSVGLAGCILIALHVQDELSYDNFYPEADRLYRVAVERIYPDRTAYFAPVPAGFAEAIRVDIPEVESVTRIVGFSNQASLVEYEDMAFKEHHLFFVDSTFFEVFPFDMVTGNYHEALQNPKTVILAKSTARKYFGIENPVGQSIEIDDTYYAISGVMEDIPENSHLKMDFIASSTNVPFLENPSYISFSSYTYIKLNKNADPGVVEGKLGEIVEQYAAGEIERRLGVSFEEYRAAGNGYHYFLQPISDIHLYSNLQSEIRPNSSIVYVMLFISVAVFILLIAGINFINLTTARSAERAREVGVRKVMGSERSSLVWQFLTESVMVSIMSLIISISLLQLMLPFFNDLIQKELELNLFGNGMIAVILISFSLAVGLLAGLYPALYMSSFKSVEVLKGKFQSSTSGKWLRNGLVVFQFAISVILIVGTLIVLNQMDYIQNKRLGFDKENVLVIEGLTEEIQSEALKDELERLADVQSVSAASILPGDNYFGISLQPPEGTEAIAAKGFAADDHFTETLNLTMVEGRSFSEEFNDAESLILNKAAVQALGLSDPIGERLVSSVNNVSTGENTPVEFTVVGVVENFNFESLRKTITPLVMLSTDHPANRADFLALKIQSANFNELLPDIQAAWKQFATGDDPFLYSFLDNNLEALYQSEQVSAKIVGSFSLLAIIIACVGLFGLSSYIATQRRKEIGVRKVLGATVYGVVFLLSKQFLKLVLLAIIVAAPITYLFMQNWLEDFAYRIDISPLTFLAAGLITGAIAVLTVSYQAIKAATMNPVESLRSE